MPFLPMIPSLPSVLLGVLEPAASQSWNTADKQWRVRLSYRDEKAIMSMGKLCSKTQAQGIYSTHRTATERENLGI
jgi:hypothetical protein